LPFSKKKVSYLGFQLASEAVTITIRYSIINVTRTPKTFKCRIRLNLGIEPHKVWSPKWRRIPKHKGVFTSDRYFKGAEELEENLLAFFPPRRTNSRSESLELLLARLVGAPGLNEDLNSSMSTIWSVRDGIARISMEKDIRESVSLACRYSRLLELGVLEKGAD
jgi:hypothetical protein